MLNNCFFFVAEQNDDTVELLEQTLSDFTAYKDKHSHSDKEVFCYYFMYPSFNNVPLHAHCRYCYGRLPTVYIVTRWSGSGRTEAYLSGQLAFFGALAQLVGSPDL